MVLEALINPIKAEQKPWESFFIGMIYASIAIIVSLSVFRAHSSMVMIALISMLAVPLIYGAIKLEEKKDLMIQDEKILIREHGKALSFFTFMFLGFTAAFIIWFLILPTATSSTLFSAQLQSISEINQVTGKMTHLDILGNIIFHNSQILLFCLIFSFFFGFGAIFILTWNASVLGAFLGSLIKQSHFMLTPVFLLKYALHGIPEILAYFTAGLAGGIISIAIIRHDIQTSKFKHILVDSFELIFFSVMLVIVAAVIEVYISPAII